MSTAAVSAVTHPSPGASHDGDDRNRVALIVVFHPETARLGDRYILDSAGTFEIGRAETADISFPGERAISRHQARIRRTRDKAFIEDLDSTNGTLVNGRFIRDLLELHSGDRIQVGSIHLKFLHESDVEYAYHEHISRILSSAARGESRANFKPASTESLPESPATLAPKFAFDDKSRIWIPQLISSAMLLVALDTGRPYEYYTLLRWVCSACFAYLTFKALSRDRPAWMWIFGAVAVVYNPIWPLHLTRQVWTYINLTTIAFSAVSLGALAPRTQRRR